MNKLFFTPTVVAETRQSLKVALPLIASELVFAISGFVATVMTAHISREALTAVALGSVIYTFLILLLIGFLSVVSILVSQNFGAKNRAGIQTTVAQGFLLGIIALIPLLLVLWYAPVAIQQWSGLDEHCVELAKTYLHTIMLCPLLIMPLTVMEHFLIGIQQTRLVMFVTLLEVPFEIVANYVFVFGKLGLPALGVAGFGYGFSLTLTLMAILLGLYLVISKKYRHYNIFARFGRFDAKYFFELVRVGWPMACSNGILLSTSIISAFFLARIGADALAAHQIIRQYAILNAVIAVAVSNATTVRVGYFVGRDDRPSIKQTMCVNLGIGLFLTTLVGIGYIVFAKPLINIDIDIYNPQYAALVHYAMQFIIIAAVCTSIGSIRFTTMGALRGLKDTKIPMYITAIGSWMITIPTGYLLGFVLRFGGVGVQMGYPIGILFTITVLLIRLKRLVNQVDLQQLAAINK